MLNELLQTLYLLSFATGTIIFLILLKRRVFRQSNLLTASFILVSLCPLWNGYFSHTENLQALTVPVFNLVYPWLFGPLLYLLCRSTLARLSLTIITVHCCYPLVIFLLQMTLQLSASEWLVQLWNHLYLKLLYSQIFVYLLLCFWQVRAGQKVTEQRFAGAQSLYWQWLGILLNGFACIFLLDLVALLMVRLDYLSDTLILDLFSLAESLYVFVLAGFVLRYPQLFFDRFDVSQKARYQNSGLNQAVAMALAKKLEHQVNHQQLYLDNDITLTSLAAKLAIPEHHLSQILSEQMQQNFYEYINRKRVDYAKSLLSSNDPKYHNILDLAYGVGFNNKSSFNAAFKRFTQLTPSQFRHYSNEKKQ